VKIIVWAPTAIAPSNEEFERVASQPLLCYACGSSATSQNRVSSQPGVRDAWKSGATRSESQGSKDAIEQR